jgi:hypothetical protein
MKTSISFVVERIQIGKRIWRMAKLSNESAMPVLEIAQTHTKRKMSHTRDESQSGVARSSELKYQKQLMGSIAETTVFGLFNLYLKKQDLAEDWRVELYDTVRTDDFMTPEGEYDLRLVNNRRQDVCYYIESRSSIAHDRALAVALAQFDIIGPYKSSIKKNEPLKDFYVRPLYAYLDYETVTYSSAKFLELFLSGRVQLYLVGGCTRSQMSENGFPKTMGQKGTVYQVVRILDGLDLFDFLGAVANVLRGS